MNNVIIDYGINYRPMIENIFNSFLCSERSRYQSFEIIKEQTIEFCNLIYEGLLYEKETCAQEKYKKEISLLSRRIARFRQFVEKSIQNKEQMTRSIYDFILSLEGMALLPGFGFSNTFGDKIAGNSEKKSIRPIIYEESSKKYGEICQKLIE